MKTVHQSIRAVAITPLVAMLYLGVAKAEPLSIPDSPLFLTNLTAPNVLVNLSIEWPMEGAAYNDENDTASGGACTGRPVKEGSGGIHNIGTCYLKTNAYLGYFNPNKCYIYQNSRFEVADNVINVNNPSLNYHECSTKWSGNLLNWITMSAIDEFRRVMTGGHRFLDAAATSSNASLTVLERANMDRAKGDYVFPLKKIGKTILPGKIDPKTVTPYTDGTLYFYNHGVQFDVGTSTATSNRATKLNARVKVCDSASEANCLTYKDGSLNNIKPAGLIQKNADSMRFAVTSYLLDNSQSRDGGVLRSKMKFTGPNRYSAGVKSTNPNTEWSATTGVFITNPDATEANASGVSNSGVINYINKFGVNGYKSYDPAGELFYEGLRYFKHLPPTPEYSSGLSSSMKDGFPVITHWDDPIQYSCQSNYIIGINDANPWLDKKLPGTAFKNSALANGTVLLGSDFGEPSNKDSTINVKELTNTVGSLEGLTGTSQCIGGDTNTYNASATNKTITGLGEVFGTCPYPPKENSYYIAGLAYYANTQDIRPDFEGKQSVSTFMIDTQEYSTTPLLGKMNMLWLAGKYGGFVDSNGNSTPDLAIEWDSNNNGEPNNYVLASKPEKLVTGLSNAFKNILVRSNNSSTSLAANSGSLQTDTVIYQTQFDSSDWSGHVFSFTLNSEGRVVDINNDGLLNGADANWDAGELIPSAASRNIYTLAATGVAFQWANLTAAQKTALKTNTLGIVGTDQEGMDRLNWLRGDNTLEERFAGGVFRNRLVNVLGDIVNSDPVYTKNEDYGYKALPTTVTGQSTYEAYLQAKTSRIPMLYTGANDGMLHGFRADLGNANSGRELFAYVPNAVYPNLSKLTDPNYVHTYFVDGPPRIGDAYIGGWKTLLVAGLGKGGKSVYALDVSNPSGFVAGNVLWEYVGGASDTGSTGTTDANGLGYTYSKPQIALLNDGTWAAIFGNGYNSATERAFLYIVNMQTGNLIKKIATNTATGNGLSTTALYDNNGDHIIDVVYAGDLQGNLWKFDLQGTSSSAWGLGNGGNPLFVARNDLAQVQPMTAAPALGSHPSGGVLVYIGTGSYLTAVDVSSSDEQSFYAIWDKPSTTGTVAKSSLVEQSITGQTIQGSQKTNADGTTTTLQFNLRTTSTNPVDYANDKRGWYIDLTPQDGVSGERVISAAQLFRDKILFLTAIPSSDSCRPGGDSWLMQMDLQSGAASSGRTFDVNKDNKVDEKDLVGLLSATGVKSTVGMSKGVVVMDTSSKISVAEVNGLNGNIMSVGMGGGDDSSDDETGKPILKYWQQLQ